MNTRIDTEQAAVIESAAQWVVQMHDSTPTPEAERQDFVAWLTQSPVHVQEFLQIEADWLAMEGVDQSKRIDVESLLHSKGENVFPLNTGSGPLAQPANFRNRSSRFVAMAATLIAAIAVGIFALNWLSTDSYETTLGEQRTVVLTDGSVVELNTQTRIKVRIDDNLRDIELVKGEALFGVEKDASRPFSVKSGSAVAVALGTRFNVYRQNEQTVVTVVEGRVAVGPDSASMISNATHSLPSPNTLELAAGEQASISTDGARRQVQTNPDKALAWRERRLVFENDALKTVAREFNRYNSQQIVIDDPVLMTREINGVFNADRPEVFIAFLARADNVTMKEIPGKTWRISATAIPR